MFPFHKGDPRPAVAISEIERDIHTEREFLGRICRLKATYRSLKEEEEVPEVEVGTLDQYILGNGSKVVASLGVVFSKVTRAKLRHYG